MASQTVTLTEALDGTAPERFVYAPGAPGVDPHLAMFLGHIDAAEASRRWTVAYGDLCGGDVHRVRHSHATFDYHRTDCTEQPGDEGFTDCVCAWELSQAGEQWFVRETNNGNRVGVAVTFAEYVPEGKPAVTSAQTGGRDHLRAALIDILTRGWDAGRPDTLTAVGAERRRQASHPVDAAWMTDRRRLAVLMTKVGDLAHLFTSHAEVPPERLQAELVGVAAVALAWLDRRHVLAAGEDEPLF